ncbi:Nuclear_LIM interactor-interacting factor [Hexamita inflata]|uniref:Nuclear LIM interactor-interacting factor n=1 Tax=Hexamita inflata TaxID=28002 RepID=A0AA86UGX7_9EUKA|nr:Nuclear LIM interactor-interacting factor [Hexamita inflata]
MSCIRHVYQMFIRSKQEKLILKKCSKQGKMNKIITQNDEQIQELPDLEITLNQTTQVSTFDGYQSKKKMLALDLDETLVCSKLQKPANYDFEIALDDPSQNSKVILYVATRPFLEQFLDEMSKYYDLFVFTAGLNEYCNAIVDKIDPKGLIIGRLSREHCRMVNEYKYLKDLKLIDGYEMKDKLLLDNSPYSIELQPENGILCPDFYGSKHDNYLLTVIDKLIFLSDVPDVTLVQK